MWLKKAILTVLSLFLVSTSTISQEIPKTPAPDTCAPILEVTQALANLGLAPFVITKNPEMNFMIYVNKELSALIIVAINAKVNIACVSYMSKDVSVNKKVLEILADEQIGKRV